MIARMKILAIVLSVVIGGSAATLAMSQEDDNGRNCGNAPVKAYAVHLAEVEALYDHDVYVIISSENGEPVCGAVEILPPPPPEKECKEEWEEKERREEGEREERECEEEETRGQEDDEDSEEEREEECERGREGCCDEGKEEEGEKERKHCEGENEEKERREHCREIKGEGCRKPSYRFNFQEGKGRLLLLPSSHRCLGATAIIKVKCQGDVRITPFIKVRDTGVVIYPDSRDEEGRYCEVERIRGGARFGFEDLMDSPDMECDWDYDDAVLFIKKLPPRKCCQKEDGDWKIKDNEKE